MTPTNNPYGFILRPMNGNSQSSADKLYERGIAYFTGDGCNPDLDEACDSWLDAADKGNPPAQYNIYLCYLKGIGFKQTLYVAYRYLKQSADNGCREAIEAYAEALETGVPDYVQKDTALAAKYRAKINTAQLKEKAYESGLPQTSSTYYAPQEPESELAAKQEQSANTQGTPDNSALNDLLNQGMLLFAADDIESKKKGIKMIEQAAEAGNGRAMGYLAYCSYNEIGQKEGINLKYFMPSTMAEKAEKAGDIEFCHIVLAHIYTNMKRYMMAQSYIHEALQKSPNNHIKSEACIMLCRFAYFGQGHWGTPNIMDAEAQLRRAQSYDPKNPDVRIMKEIIDNFRGKTDYGWTKTGTNPLTFTI